jgi:hypothetical protein
VDQGLELAVGRADLPIERGVVRLLGELDQDGEVVPFFLDRLPFFACFFQTVFFLDDPAGGGGVLPEIGRLGPFLQEGKPFFQAIEVKDAPGVPLFFG